MKTKGNYRHGSAKKGSVTRTYKKWLGMRSRCTNPAEDSYPHYGGRGIKVCERWNSYANFLEDMGEAPEGMSIERKDRDKDYEPGNCKWATTLEQVRNRSNSLIYEHNGKKLPAIEWAKELGISYKSLLARLYRGQTIEEALTAGVRKPGKKPKK